jgi:hypothetical protein
MKKENEHSFLTPKEFEKMRNLYLNRVEEEITRCIMFFNPSNVNSTYGTLKEISLAIISHLLRKCIELELIDPKGYKEKFNSIVHSHLVIHLDNGDVLLKSDHDIEHDRNGVLVSYKFLLKLREDLENWKGYSLDSNY